MRAKTEMTPGTRRDMVDSRIDPYSQHEFSFPEWLSPQSLLSLRGMVQELERSGADPTLWIGFRYRGTDWSFVKRTSRPAAD
jgi:hypothetical protein